VCVIRRAEGREDRITVQRGTLAARALSQLSNAGSAVRQRQPGSALHLSEGLKTLLVW
jgi:hypothetical protein